MSKREARPWTALMVALVVAFSVATWLEYRACDGRLVRGLLWWECIEDAP